MSTPQEALVGQLAADLAAETTALTSILSGLPAAAWEKDTPAESWTIRDQVTHLAFFDDATRLAVTDPAGFLAQRTELLSLGDRFPDVIAARYRHLTGSGCSDWFLRSRDALLAACRTADPGVRLPWYGPDMGLASSLTGRLMETWAHSQDIVDCLGLSREPTARLRHVASLGVRTFAFSFQQRGLAVPEEAVRVELTGPGGEGWAWGPQDAANRVEGDALDFCLVVTQRRNVADTRLRVAGAPAAGWLAIAQAFAGRPTDPRPAGLLVPPGSSATDAAGGHR